MTLVLLPPIGLDAGCWAWHDLGGLDVMRHEFPGFGRPRAPEQPELAALADEVAASYPGPLHVAGVSLGGMVAQHLALRHPERVRSLVLACTTPAADPELSRARAADVEARGMEGVLEETLARWFTPAALGATVELPGVAYARRALLALDPAAMADGWRAIAGHDLRARVGAIAAPATCLAASADVATPPERLGELAAAMQNARLVVLEGAHMTHLERPAEFSAAVRDHLQWAEGS